MTPTADRILAYIVATRARTGISPDTREIVAACGLSSTSVAAYHIRRLERAGRVTVARGQARGVVPAGERRVYLEPNQGVAILEYGGKAQMLPFVDDFDE